MDRDTTACVAGSNRFRRPSVTDGQTDRQTDGQTNVIFIYDMCVYEIITHHTPNTLVQTRADFVEIEIESVHRVPAFIGIF